MAKSLNGARRTRRANAQEMFLLGDKMRDRGKLRAAFRLFLGAAREGNRSAQLNVGYCYDTGLGTTANRTAALYWYKRAYRRGDAIAAHNIGTIWRDAGKWKQALGWFSRAVKLGNHNSNLEIAKLYLRDEHTIPKAIPYLKKVHQSNRATQYSVEQARRLLKRAENKPR